MDIVSQICKRKCQVDLADGMSENIVRKCQVAIPPDIFSHICSDILSGIMSYIFSDIPSAIPADIFSHICSDMARWQCLLNM